MANRRKGPLWYGILVVFLVGVAFWLGFKLGRGSVPKPKPVPVSVRPRAAAPVPAAPFVFPKGQGKIAIVLDDWGYSLNQLPTLESIRQPLTVAILPGLAHSADVAKGAKAKGHEVILHMPMEALDSHAPREAGTLLTHMSRQEILQHLTQSLESVPFARGISNHQGSKATADRPFMEVVLREVKRRRLYFLDSMTGDSVCGDVAHHLKIPYARRAVFLDNDKSPAAIEGQLVELARLAGKKGYAIGIGHDRSVTMKVLQEALPALRQAGYTVVPVSELAEAP